MCPNLENYTTQQLLFPRTCNVAEFSPFLEGESGDGLLAYVTGHITHTHTHTHSDKYTGLSLCRHLTPGFRYSVRIQVLCEYLWACMSCPFIRGDIPPSLSHTPSDTHTILARKKRVSPCGVPFKSASLHVPVNHSCGRHNIRWSRRAGGTVTRKRTSRRSRCCENMEFDRLKDKHPLGGHRTRVVNDPGMHNK